LPPELGVYAGGQVEEGVDEEGQEEGEEKDLLPGSVAIHFPWRFQWAGILFGSWK
jgi:hypothetical protein